MAESSLENLSDDQKNDLAALAHKLANDPKTRESFLRMTKAISPNTPIPEIDLQDRMRAYAKPFEDKITSLETKLTLADAKENVRSRRQEAQKELQLSDAEMEGVEKLMVDHQIPNYKSAAEFFRLQRQAAEPTPHSIFNPTNEMPADAMTAMKKGPAALANWARKDASSMISDIRSGKLKVG